ncbi:MAG: PmoA family protein [Bacteroidales bacterium]|nr:PmoA family protein [Bacteroidales bacterium]
MRTILIMLMTGLPILSCSQETDRFTIITGDSEATIYSGENPVLSYVHKETLPPEGINPLYKRSAYIHPLWSPGGERLTRIQPPDHYHHYGIWNPWTRTRFGDRKVDFWNLADAQGTVRFAEYQDKFEQKEYAGFKVRQEHIYFREDGTEGIAMNEVWDIRVLNTNEKVYVVDLTTTLNTPLEKGLTLEAYRYGGGLGFRATEKWHTNNSTVLTSEGKKRIDADGTGARWVIIEGESSVSEGRSGILFLSHPSNRAHPEPMRMWPPDSQEGKGNVFFEFCPIRHLEWVLEKDKNYTLKYRMVVFDGEMNIESVENYWQAFAN